MSLSPTKYIYKNLICIQCETSLINQPHYSHVNIAINLSHFKCDESSSYPVTCNTLVNLPLIVIIIVIVIVVVVVVHF